MFDTVAGSIRLDVAEVVVATDNNEKPSFGAQLLYTPRPAVTVAVNLITGPEKPQDDTDRRSSLDTWIRSKVSGLWSFAVSARAEFFRDPDGERTGMKQTLREVTITPEWKPAKSLAVRGELRHDWSTEPVFEQSDWHSKGQTTVALGSLIEQEGASTDRLALGGLDVQVLRRLPIAPLQGE